MCEPTLTAESDLGKGVTYMEYSKDAVSGGYFPKVSNEDRNDFLSDMMVAYGSPAGTCTDYRSACSDEAIKAVCPQTCGSTNTANAGFAVVNPPSGTGPFPLFVYFPGTELCHTRKASLQIAHEMAKRGFVSAAVEYPGLATYGDFPEKAQALTNGTGSPLGMLCALNGVDCSLGIASAGYSQGGHLAAMIAKYTENIPGAPKVTAVLGIASGRPYYWGPRPYDYADDAVIGHLLPKERRRFMVIEGDADFAKTLESAVAEYTILSGYDQTSKCPATMGTQEQLQCKANAIQSDGSGYFIIENKDLAPLPSWFASSGMGWHEAYQDWLSDEWVQWFLTGPEVWAMPKSLDWLAKTAKSGPPMGTEKEVGSNVLTCGEIKKAYKESKCCKNPSNPFKMNKEDQRRLMSADVEEEALLAWIESSLKEALSSGGQAAASKLANQIELARKLPLHIQQVRPKPAQQVVPKEEAAFPKCRFLHGRAARSLYSKLFFCS